MKEIKIFSRTCSRQTSVYLGNTSSTGDQGDSASGQWINLESCKWSEISSIHLTRSKVADARRNVISLGYDKPWSQSNRPHVSVPCIASPLFHSRQMRHCYYKRLRLHTNYPIWTDKFTVKKNNGSSRIFLNLIKALCYIPSWLNQNRNLLSAKKWYSAPVTINRTKRFELGQEGLVMDINYSVISLKIMSARQPLTRNCAVLCVFGQRWVLWSGKHIVANLLLETNSAENEMISYPEFQYFKIPWKME